MNKTLKIVLGILAVVAIAAGVSYAIYRYLNKEEKKTPLAFFKSKFNDDGSVEAIDATEEVLNETVEEPAAPCDDAVCAVDMCMPY